MNFENIGAVTTRASLAMFVVTMAMSAPADAKPVRGGQKPMVATMQHDDRFPWLDQGYAPVARSGSKREGRTRTARARSSSRVASVSHAPHQGVSGAASFGGSGLVAEARRYLGTNPTGRSSLWCARFMNMVLERAGRRGSGSDMASSFASYGSRVSGPQVGAIAVMSRGKRGGHVGIVSGIDANGNPIIISGNHSRRVAESTYPRGRVYAYVMP
jgi:uncharacterized protein (TIGR02594 family)